MGKVPFVDATGIAALKDLNAQFAKRSVRLVICEVRTNVAIKLSRAGLVADIGSANIFASLEQFVASTNQPHAPNESEKI